MNGNELFSTEADRPPPAMRLLLTNNVSHRYRHTQAETINKAAEMASGEFIGVLDPDDELDLLTLFQYVKTINEHPDADCIGCNSRLLVERTQ